MATESADETDVSVSLPSDLEEWLDDRAAALDVDRGKLLVQLAAAYRAAADHGDDHLAELLEVGPDAELLEDIEERLASEERALGSLDDRVDDVEADLEENVEDLRNRVLQLRDAVGDAASQNHGHREFSKLDSRIDELSEGLESVAGDVEAQGDRIETLDERLDDVEAKLTRVARAVVALRREADGDGDDGTLEDVRQAANRAGVSEAACGACGAPVSVGLLTDPDCPHCGTGFEGLDVPEPGMGRRLGFRRPELRCVDPPALEGGDE